MVYENHNRNFEPKDESSILRELLVKESVNSNTIENNEKLISFLHKPSLKSKKFFFNINIKNVFYIFIFYMLILSLLSIVFLLDSEFEKILVFLVILLLSIVLTVFSILLMSYSNKVDRKENLEKLTKDVLKELEYKNLAKEILEEYDEILNLPIVSDENKNIIIKITSIIDNLFNLTYSLEYFTDWELNRKYMQAIKEGNLEAIRLGNFLLERLLFENIDNTYGEIGEYFDYIESEQDNISGQSYSMVIDLKNKFKEFPWENFIVSKMFTEFNFEDRFRFIQLGADIEHFRCDFISDKNIKEINKEIKYFYDELCKFFIF